MPRVINSDGELLRINNDGGIDYSCNNGLSWIHRAWCPNGAPFIDIVEHNGKIIGATRMGIYESTNNGLGWRIVCNDTSREYYALVSAGNELVCETSEGTFYSCNDGSSWIPRR